MKIQHTEKSKATRWRSLKSAITRPFLFDLIAMPTAVSSGEPGLHAASHLVVHEDVHHVVVHLLSDLALGSPGEQHKLDAKQRDKDQGGSHCFHVQVGLSLVGVFQLGYENANDVQQEEKVHLSEKEMTLRKRSEK